MNRHSRRHFLRGSLSLASLGVLSGCAISPIPVLVPTRVRRIGVLGDAPEAQWDAFFDGLRELGYVEGQNLSIDYRWARGDSDRHAVNAADLTGLEVECIVIGSINASILAKPANTTVPMVAILLNRDAVEVGLVANIARPEGNITGTAGAPGLRLHAKLIQILQETVPDVERVAVLAHARQATVDVILNGIKDAAGQLGLQVEIGMVQGPEDVESAFSAVSAAGTRALMLVNSSPFNAARSGRTASLALAHRLPSITTDEEYSPAGGLMSYGVNGPDTYRHAASYVDKILKGARPADLPMERPRKYDFIINLKTAQALGLTLPPSVLAQATEIIQ